jgi:polyhydroxybutyrate depolymerase
MEHAGRGSATGIANTSGKDTFTAFADRAGFIAFFPDSVNGNWDDSRDTIPEKTNDVAFIDVMLDEIAKDYNLDTKRVYATGVSNGGMMTLRLACESAKRFAAVATVAANMPVALASKCSPGRAIPLMMMSGDADPIMPFVGGSIAGGISGNVLSVTDSIKFWLNKNALAPEQKAAPLNDYDPADGTFTTLYEYGPPGGASEVLLYSIRGGGHTWPSGAQYLPETLIGKVSRDFSGDDAIWSFFSKHALS